MSYFEDLEYREIGSLLIITCANRFFLFLQRVPPLRVNDLIEDLKDGTKLLALLEVLSGERLQVERGRNLRRPHFLSNANTALQFLLSKKVRISSRTYLCTPSVPN